jgi:histidinol-phosphate/aromatic aminotransferase/cobyric acid decarboxylase-like protein
MGGKPLFKRLLEEGILVRAFESPRLRDMLRVTVGHPEENLIFIDRLRAITAGTDKP